jgi:hypothetical protein
MLFLGALCPSKSGLMNKHIVKHIVHFEFLMLGLIKVKCSEVFRRLPAGSVGALYPSKSGLMNKHIVFGAL